MSAYYVCRMCGDGFDDPRDLTEHQRRHRCDCENCVDGMDS